MAINISIDNASGLQVGGTTVSFQDYLDDFDANFSPALYGQFNESNTYPDFYGTEYIVSEDADLFADLSAQSVIANGDLEYDFGTHVLSGDLDSVEFGYGGYEYSGDFALDQSDITISNLGLSDGTVHNVIYGLMQSDPGALETVLASDSINYSGSAAADIFTGYGYDDVINGQGGNDVLGGGAGSDTFVFSGTFGSDEITDFSLTDGDILDFTGVSAIADFTDLVNNHLSAAGGTGYAVIDDGSGNSVTLDGHAFASFSSDFSSSDFLFA